MSVTGTFDYVIVGGGTAGLVLANRLTEDPKISVAVVEAGENTYGDPRSVIPGLWMAALDSELSWGFVTTPQVGLDVSLAPRPSLKDFVRIARDNWLNGRCIGHAQGKALGGSSATNVQALIPFSASDINAWESLGNQNWNWEILAPYLLKTFTLSPLNEEIARQLHTSWADNLRSHGEGPVQLSFTGGVAASIGKAWVETFESLGYPLTASPFEGYSTGPYNAASTVDPTTSTRVSSQTAYLQPVIGRPNLTIFTGTIARKIVLESGKTETEPTATGVEVEQEGKIFKLYTKREVILSAGVFNSPKLLELSGIGDPKILDPLGIHVNVMNSYVGTNLQDHLLTAISFQALDIVPTADALIRKDPAALQSAMELYHEQKTGPLTSPGITEFAYLPTVDFVNDVTTAKAALDSVTERYPTHPLDDARKAVLESLIKNGNEGTGQYFILHAQTTAAGGDATAEMGTKVQEENFLSLVVALSHPMSTGTTHITSTDTSGKPTIDHNYLAHPADLEIQARNVRYLDTIASTAPFSEFLVPDGKRNHPTAFLNDDLERAKEYVRIGSSTNWHSCGTCAMAPKDKGGVVDAQLKVYGAKGLRICDASVFPLVPQSNLQSLVYTVAERAADIIKGKS